MTPEALLELRREAFRFNHIRNVTWAEIRAFCQSMQTQAAQADIIVGVLRNGAPIAAILAELTGRPLEFVLLNAQHTTPLWLGKQLPRGRRLLVVDDTCGTGFTFNTLRTFFEAEGNHVKTLSMFYSLARHRPDYGNAVAADIYLRWPWEGEDDVLAPTGITS